MTVGAVDDGPGLVRRAVHRSRDWLDRHRLVRHWARLHSASASPAPASPAQRARQILIVPTDPHHITGSSGDEAMLRTVIARARHAWSEERCTIVTSSSHGDAAARALGAEAARLWTSPQILLNGVVRARPLAAYVLGADALDGHYAVASSARLAAVADVLARAGTPVTVVGFSFNTHPALALQSLFAHVDRRVRWCARDALSHARFTAFSGQPAILTADVAFLLDPDPSAPAVDTTARWVATERAVGRRVVGFNIHRLLFAGAVELEALIARAAESLRTVVGSGPVSVVLLRHDHRARGGDDRVMSALRAALEPVASRILDPGNAGPAATKAIVGQLDGVITGRMHVAIAALGVGVPTMALTYQDKFDGLFDHFGLPRDLLIAPRQALEPGALRTAIDSFLGRLDDLGPTVRASVPRVRALAERTFEREP